MVKKQSRWLLTFVFVTGAALANEPCGKAVTNPVVYAPVYSITQTLQQLGQQKGSALMRRANLTEAEFRRALVWLKRNNFVSALNDLPGSDAQETVAYLNVTQSRRLRSFFAINESIRSHQEGPIEKAFLDDVKTILATLLSKSWLDGRTFMRILGWNSQRLENALLWAIRADFVKSQNPARIDLDDIFSLQASTRPWAEIFSDFALPDQV